MNEVKDKIVLQHLPRLEREIRESRNTDKQLINWWLYLFVVAPVTFGIYSIVILFQRINRRDKHFTRIKDVFKSAIDVTKEIAEEKEVDIHGELSDIDSRLKQEENILLKPKGAGLWLFLTIITFGIAGIFVAYFLTTDWYRLQRFEQEMLDDFNKAWAKAGITKYPITMDVTVRERSFWLYLLLTILTLGFWGLYWDHSIHTDPGLAFKESARWEETMLNSFRQV